MLDEGVYILEQSFENKRSERTFPRCMKISMIHARCNDLQSTRSLGRDFFSVIRRRPIEILRSLESFLEQSRDSQYRSPLSSWILSEPCQIGKRLDGFWWAGEVNQGWLFACSWIKWVIVLMIVRERIILLAKLRRIFVNISEKGVAI